MTEGVLKNGDKSARSPGPGSASTQFKPGNSGKPKGSRHKATIIAEQLFDKAAEKLTALCIEKAQDGDSFALRFALERIIPPRKERPIKFKLPPLEKADDAASAMAAITAAVAEGELTLSEAESMAKLVDAFVRAIEIGEFGQRLKALEDRAEK